MALGPKERCNTMDDDAVVLGMNRNNTDYKERHLKIDTQHNKLRVLKIGTVLAGSPVMEQSQPAAVAEEGKSQEQTNKSTSDANLQKTG